MIDLFRFLDESYTSYHAVKNVATTLTENGFEKVSDKTRIKTGGKYFVTDGGSVVSFAIGGGKSFHICASHTDSPSFRIKGASLVSANGLTRLDTEKYGGGLIYSFLDRPLKIAGRVSVETEYGVEFRLVQSDYNVVIPSMCIHHNPTANDGVAFNLQNDTLPLFSQKEQDLYFTLTYGKVIDGDLYVVPATPAFSAGANNEFICSPRIDNLTSVYSSMLALVDCEPSDIAICAMLDNEEIGSVTRVGNPRFLEKVVRFIEHGLGFSEEDSLAARRNGMILSVDNGHAVHPAHPEKSDPNFPVKLNGGPIVKHHTNYATNGATSAVFKKICALNNIAVQDYYNRSDVRCGSTLGSAASIILQMQTCDIGLAQLAMHSACETVGAHDIEAMRRALTAFLNCRMRSDENGTKIR